MQHLVALVVKRSFGWVGDGIIVGEWPQTLSKPFNQILTPFSIPNSAHAAKYSALIAASSGHRCPTNVSTHRYAYADRVIIG